MEPSENPVPPPHPTPAATPPPLSASIAPGPSPIYPARPAPPRSSNGWKWAVGLIALGCLGFWLVGLFGHNNSHPRKAKLDGKFYQEHTLTDKDVDDKILVIEIGGVISSHDMDGSGNMVERVKDEFELASKDDLIKAVLLKVDSPGGEVLASDDIYQIIREFQEKTGKPVVATMGSLAASGGYYVSAPCRWIVAHELTITGSIGVIMSGLNVRGLMDKVGIRPEVYKSGKFKDMMSSTRPPEEVTAAERQMVQALIDETYGTFKAVVGKGRADSRAQNTKAGLDKESRALTSDWELYADGRIFSGREAHKLGFVDELGGFEVAMNRAKKLAGITEANVVKFEQPFNFGNFFRLFGKSEARGVKVDLGLDFPRLQAGRMYFLSPTILQ